MPGQQSFAAWASANVLLPLVIGAHPNQISEFNGRTVSSSTGELRALRLLQHCIGISSSRR